ncbi:MAG TPA: hypothetical protein VGV18_07115 [Verrucomicrobiae bacterium]|nr:hypothetical protein [Verrucomicrobiae bacterium]
MTLAEYNNSIRSRADFAAFARALSADLHDNPETWENGSLERFLEALAAWAEDNGGYSPGQGKPPPKQPDWRIIGDMLMAAKAHEPVDEMAPA